MNQGFGLRLKKSIKKAGYTQKEVVEKLNLSKNSITNYVNGRIPKAEILQDLANICNVSMEWLLTGEETGIYPRSKIKQFSPAENGSSGSAVRETEADFIQNSKDDVIRHIMEEYTLRAESEKRDIRSYAVYQYIKYINTLAEDELLSLLPFEALNDILAFTKIINNNKDNA